jgi:hypothetical protein
MHLIQYFMRMARPRKRPAPGDGIRAYFDTIRAGIRRRSKEEREEQEEDE